MEPIWNELNMERVAGRTVAQAMVESDIPLPAGRETQRILHVQGQIHNDAAHCSAGRVQADGTLTLQMLCLDSENRPFGVRASTQYSHNIPLDGVEEGMRAQVKPQLMDLRYSLNDRRVHLETIAELNTVVRQNDSVQVLADIGGVDDLQKQFQEIEASRLMPVGNSTVRIREEIPAPGAQQVLLANAQVQVQNATLEENGLGVQGMLYVSALYMDADGQLNQATQQFPFEELIPMELDARTCTSVSVSPTVKDMSISVGGDGDMLEAEAAVTLDASCISRERMNALADAYAPDQAVNCAQETMEQLNPVAVVRQICPIHETLRVPEGLPDVSRVSFVNARPTVLGTADDGGQLAVDGLLVTSVVFQSEESMLMGFEEDVPFRCTLNTPFTPDAEITLNVLQIHENGSGRNINVDYVLETEAMVNELRGVTLAVSAEPAEPVARRNGIMINFAPAGETFWDVGKRHGVTTAQLKQWNPGVTEPFAEGTPVFVLSAAGKKHKI
jgi:hypothetical protein